MTQLFDIRDYGAVADDGSDDTAAIASAVGAARAAGGGAVYVPSGTFHVSGDASDPSVGGITLYSDIDLMGDGMGLSVVKLIDGFDARINGIVRTTPSESVSNVTISNLTIDGNRANNADHQAGFICGVKEDGSGRIHENITLSNVEAKDCTGYGIDPHEFTRNMTIEGCVSHGNGDDGITLDGVIGGLVRDNLAFNNDRHGFNLTTSTSDVRLENNVSYGNGSSGLVVQRGDIFAPGTNDVAWPSNIQIVGGAFYANQREGVLIKLSDGVTVTGAAIHDNLLQGVRIEGASGTVIDGNTIYNNANLGDGLTDEINIRSRFDDASATPRTYYSTDTLITNNTIYSTDATAPRYGVREELGNSSAAKPSGTLVSANTISGAAAGPYFIPPYSVTNGDDLLPGTKSGDAFAGQLGNDTYIVNHSGDTVTEQANAGTDTVYSSLNFVLPNHVENLFLTDNAVRGTGNGLANVVVGNALDNQLTGLGGADTLDGGAGADLMTGGDGDDVYVVDDARDTIVEKAHSGLGGIDTVYASVDTVLPEQVEVLVLTGSSDLAATGNGLANTLIGNAGDNVLDGAAGADTMVGGLGDDTYIVDHTGDSVREAFDAGVDTIVSSLSYTLGDNVERLVLSGTVALNGTGNGGANSLVGNAGANRLHGMGGDDTLEGGLGTDQLYGDGGNDTFVLRKGEFSGDTVEDFYGNGGADGDRLLFTGFGASATLTRVSGNLWQVSENGYVETFMLKAGGGLDVSDYAFDGASGSAAAALIADASVTDTPLLLPDQGDTFDFTLLDTRAVDEAGAFRRTGADEPFAFGGVADATERSPHGGPDYFAYLADRHGDAPDDGLAGFASEDPRGEMYGFSDGLI